MIGGLSRQFSFSARGTGPKTRRRPGSPNNQHVPLLKEFLHKQTVLRQYRSFLRAVKLISDSQSRSTAIEEVRRSYRLDTMDKLSIQMAVKEVRSAFCC